MSLNIKNQRVHDLAREAARLRGKSQTAVIEEALERLLHDHGVDLGSVEVERKLDLVRAIAADYRQDPGQADRAIDRVEDLFEESTGMPR